MMAISMTMTMKFEIALVLVACWSLVGSDCFQALPSITRQTQGKQTHHTFLASSAKNTTVTSTDQATESLSGLVTGMLQSHQEMAQVLAVKEAHQDEGMPPLGNDGIYRILNENQYR
jgi:hypothetical protein